MSCVSMHTRVSLHVQVNETKLHQKLIAVSGFINANCLGGFVPCSTRLFVFGFQLKCVPQNETHSICLW